MLLLVVNRCIPFKTIFSYSTDIATQYCYRCQNFTKSPPSQQTKIVTATALASNTRTTPIHDRLRSRNAAGTTLKLPASTTANTSKARGGTKNKRKNLDEKQ